MEKYIENGNIKIFLNEELVNDSKRAILLIHGFSEHGGKYVDFIKNLNEQGFSVFAMDLRGHGRTTGKKGDMQNIEKVISDVECVMKYIKSEHSFDEIGIFGHSTGGLVASIYTSLNNENVNFLILSSPAIYCPKQYRKINIIPYNLINFIYLKKNNGVSKELSEFYKNDIYSLQKFSIRTIGVIFKEGIRMLNKVLNINCPALLVCGRKDEIFKESNKFEMFFTKFTNKNSKIIIYDDAKHRIVHNEGSEERIKDINDWLKVLPKE